jgi:hypothetical protein
MDYKANYVIKNNPQSFGNSGNVGSQNLRKSDSERQVIFSMKHEYKHQLLLHIYSWYKDFISCQQQHTLKLPLVNRQCDGIK